MGLLSKRENQNCPNGHGPMQLQDGFWALSQVAQGGLMTNGAWYHTGGLYTVVLYRCTVCGVVLMKDKV